MILIKLRSQWKKNGIKQTLGKQNAAKTVNERRAEIIRWTWSVRTGLCPLGGLEKHVFLPKFTPFFPNLILEL
jgi:hypothetical protein